MSEDNDESCCCFISLITAALFIIAAGGINIFEFVAFSLGVFILVSILIVICFHCIRCIKADIDKCYRVETPVYDSDDSDEWEGDPDYESEEDKEIDYVIVVNPDHISIAVEVVN